MCPRYHAFIGGVEEHVKNISERLVKRIDLMVATIDLSGRLPNEEIVNGVRVVRFKCWALHESYFYSGQFEKSLVHNSARADCRVASVRTLIINEVRSTRST